MTDSVYEFGLDKTSSIKSRRVGVKQQHSVRLLISFLYLFNFRVFFKINQHAPKKGLLIKLKNCSEIKQIQEFTNKPTECFCCSSQFRIERNKKSRSRLSLNTLKCISHINLTIVMHIQ